MEKGRNFVQMSGDVDGLVSSARSTMSALEGQFKGVRATKIFGEWDSMQRGLDSAVESLRTAGELLNQAAKAFSDVDRM
jgi:uncharacterized protein YukE